MHAIDKDALNTFLGESWCIKKQDQLSSIDQ